MIGVKYQEVWKELIKDAKTRRKRRVRVLDIGCRNRELLSHFPKNSGLRISYKGVDLIEGFDICKHTLPEKFTYVVMLDVLEHLYDPVKGVKNAVRMLENEGKMIIVVPNAISWRRIFSGGKESEDHLFSFTKDSIKNLLEYCGLKVEKMKYVSWLPKIKIKSFEGRFSESILLVARKNK